MEPKTKDFLKKVKVNTYIYTLTFMVVALWYAFKHAAGAEVSMLLLAAFAFYTLGRQISLLADLEAGKSVDTQPRVSPIIRGVVYLVVILMVLSVIIS
ncbi:MAG TPA: hypothetical protein DD648_01970 [Candidatus Omnitrophica bacterium]|nr:hypothetical protein [Candidatus Omnitrophota bacterium]